MTDFGPLIANPKSFLLGAAAQLGIYSAYFLAIFLGFNGKAAAAISIIGGADGPTSIFLAGKITSDRTYGTNRGSSIFLYVTGTDHSATDHEIINNRRRTKDQNGTVTSSFKDRKNPVPDHYHDRCLPDSSNNCSTGWYADAWKLIP